MSQQKKHSILLALGLASTIAVQVLAGGHWSHAVWAPSLIMLLTSLTRQTGIVSPATKRIVMLMLGTGSAIGVQVLAKGPWAHAVWVPTLLMLGTDLVKVSGVDDLAPGDSKLAASVRKPAADDPSKPTPPTEPPKAA